MSWLSGVSAFPITPTDSSGCVDTMVLRKLVARLSQTQVDSIGLLGSTGVYMYLTREERRRAVEVVLDEIQGRTPVVVGVGALRTDEAVKLAQDAKAAGASAGLLAPVSYTPSATTRCFEHFTTVARDAGLPICIYDNPSTTHFRFSTELLGRLAQSPGIVAIKSLAGPGEETTNSLTTLRRLVPSGFSLGYSVDQNVAEVLLAGADTWYSVLGGLFPTTCLKIVRAASQGNAAEVRRLAAALEPVWDLFRQFSSLRVVYALADLLDICRCEPPRPILPASDTARRRIAEAFDRLPAKLKK